MQNFSHQAKYTFDRHASTYKRRPLWQNTRAKINTGLIKNYKNLRLFNLFSDFCTTQPIALNKYLQVCGLITRNFQKNRMNNIPMELCERKSYKRTIKLLGGKFRKRRLDSFIKYIQQQKNCPKSKCKLSFEVSIAVKIWNNIRFIFFDYSWNPK